MEVFKMPISARLDYSVINKLETISRLEGLSKSKVVAKSIIEYFNNHFPTNTPYELGKMYFGKTSSGKKDLSKNRKKYMKEKLHAKYSNN
jgi:hypothetical protein